LTRLFVAVELPRDVRRGIESWRRDLGRELPAARWVAETQLHLTLRFLSDVAADRVPDLIHALRPVLGARRPFDLEVGGGGVFPERGPARVLWVGVRASDDLLGLQRVTARAAEDALELAAEARPFHPHVTVGRCRRAWPRPAAQRWCERAPSRFAEPFPVRAATLVESELSADGARHGIVERFPLAGEPPGAAA
jgi:2'-5' RNA ligase